MQASRSTTVTAVWRPVRLLVSALALTMATGQFSPAYSATCGPGYADLTASGTVDVLDVQCAVLVTLWTLQGEPTLAPPCAAAGINEMDLNCDGSRNIVDVIFFVNTAIGGGLSVAADSDQDGCPDLCQAAVSDVVINEVLYDPPGPDVDVFIELAGPPGQLLEGWQLRGIDGAGGATTNTIDLEGSVGDDGFFVVAGFGASPSITEAADQFSVSANLPNGPDSLQLFNAEDEVVDAVGYGLFGGAAVFAGEGSPAPDAANGNAIARGASSVDSDDNGADFALTGTPTPGSPNVAANAAPSAVLECVLSAPSNVLLPFDAAESADPDGAIASYVFDFGDGADPLESTAPAAGHTYTEPGLYVASLQVIDNDGAIGTANCTIEITGPAVAPVVSITSPAPGTSAEPGELVAVVIEAAAAPDQGPVEVELYFGGAMVASDDASPFEVEFQIPLDTPPNGTVELVAAATDAFGVTSQSAPVALVFADALPTALLSVVPTGTTSAFVDASSSFDAETPDDALEFRWDFDGDGGFDTEWGAPSALNHDFGVNGNYAVRVEVRDDAGQVAAATKPLELNALSSVFGIIGDSVWSDTVLLTGNVIVEEGATLTIEPGTVVVVPFVDSNGDGLGDFSLSVLGSLLALGAEDAPVVFTVFGEPKQPGAWAGLALGGTGSVLNHTLIEFATNGITVVSGDHAMDETVIQDSLGCGVLLDGGSLAASTSTLEENGCGAWIRNGAVLNLADSIVADNSGLGLYFDKSAGGLITRNQIMDNGQEGVRIVRFGSGAAPSVITNNIAGNGSGGSLTVEDADLAVSTTAEEIGVVSDGPWTSPNGAPIAWARVAFDSAEPGVVTATVADGGTGAALLSANEVGTRWFQVIPPAVSSLTVSLDDSSMEVGGSLGVDATAVFRTDVAREVTVINEGDPVDLRYNYFGTFPDLSGAVELVNPSSVDLSGFVGVAYDDTWANESFVQGVLPGDTVWSGTVFVTGDVELPESSTLTVQAGTEIRVAPVDVDEDGLGDVEFAFFGAVDFAGTSEAPITVTVESPAPIPGDWGGMQVYGPSVIEYTTIEYAAVGIEAAAEGPHTWNALTAAHSEEAGIAVTGGGDVLATLSLLHSNGWGLRVESGSATLDTCTVRHNIAGGVQVAGTSADASISHSRVHDNVGPGVEATSSLIALSQSDVSANGMGMRLSGAVQFDVQQCAVTGNRYEGVFVADDISGASPTGTINFSNLAGNSTESGGAVVTAALSANSLPATIGQSFSSAWTAPDGGIIEAVRAEFSLFGDGDGGVTAELLNGDSGGTVAAVLPGLNNYAVGSADSPLTSIQLRVDDASETLGAQASVLSAYYRTGSAQTEFASVSATAAVNATQNYWGVFPNISSRIAVLGGSVVNSEGFASFEISDAGAPLPTP